MKILHQAARHGRLLLIAGLIAGFTLPGLAAALKPWLPQMVAGLVFVTALRIGLRAAAGNLAQARGSLLTVLVLQLCVPAAFLPLTVMTGWIPAPMALALVLAMAAPPISGGPAFTAMLGHDPAPAMRLLVLGTLLVPLTVLPVFWLLPALGTLSAVALAALRLTAVITLAIAAAFTLRRVAFPDPSPDTIRALDGIAAIALAVIVIALMSAVGPALRDDPASFATWLTLACAVNFGMQAVAFAVTRDVPTAIMAGNRNIALFLVALPAGITDPILIFIGCYQVPMYLTPLVMSRLYARPA